MLFAFFFCLFTSSQLGPRSFLSRSSQPFIITDYLGQSSQPPPGSVLRGMRSASDHARDFRPPINARYRPTWPTPALLCFSVTFPENPPTVRNLSHGVLHAQILYTKLCVIPCTKGQIHSYVWNTKILIICGRRSPMLSDGDVLRVRKSLDHNLIISHITFPFHPPTITTHKIPFLTLT
jgi:hypothetical protein